jgi:hypothetical protein
VTVAVSTTQLVYLSEAIYVSTLPRCQFFGALVQVKWRCYEQDSLQGAAHTHVQRP